MYRSNIKYYCLTKIKKKAKTTNNKYYEHINHLEIDDIVIGTRYHVNDGLNIYIL